MLVSDFSYFLLICCHGNGDHFFCKKISKKSTKIVLSFVLFKLNASWIKLLVAKRHLYISINNHNFRCGKRKNEFDINFVTKMCLKSGWGNQI